jgi:hypothetical protein
MNQGRAEFAIENKLPLGECACANFYCTDINRPCPENPWMCSFQVFKPRYHRLVNEHSHEQAKICPGCQQSLKLVRDCSAKNHMVTCSNWGCRLFRSPIGYVEKFLNDDKRTDEQLLGRFK